MRKAPVIAIVIAAFICVNLINIKHGPTYACSNGMEAFTYHFSSYGIPFPYIQRSLHGSCRGAPADADFGHRFSGAYLLLDGACGVSLIVIANKLLSDQPKKRIHADK